MSDLSQSEISRAARNEPVGEFTLVNTHTGESRTFELKDLEYDAYIEFCDLARPIIMSVAGVLQGGSSPDGSFKLQYNPAGIDYAALIKMAGAELPRMAHIVCKQSAPKITLAEVKRLGRRPFQLLEIVLMQIKQNKIVSEFADFFPRIAGALQELIPQAQEALEPVPAMEATA